MAAGWLEGLAAAAATAGSSAVGCVWPELLWQRHRLLKISISQRSSPTRDYQCRNKVTGEAGQQQIASSSHRRAVLCLCGCFMERMIDP